MPARAHHAPPPCRGRRCAHSSRRGVGQCRCRRDRGVRAGCGRPRRDAPRPRKSSAPSRTSSPSRTASATTDSEVKGVGQDCMARSSRIRTVADSTRFAPHRPRRLPLRRISATTHLTPGWRQEVTARFRMADLVRAHMDSYPTGVQSYCDGHHSRLVGGGIEPHWRIRCSSTARTTSMENGSPRNGPDTIAVVNAATEEVMGPSRPATRRTRTRPHVRPARRLLHGRRRRRPSAPAI